MFQPLSRQDFIQFARFTVLEQTKADISAPAQQVADDLKRFDPQAAELWLKSAAALKEMSDHFKQRLVSGDYDKAE